MSGNLDKSLDTIMSESKTARPRPGGRRPTRRAATKAKAVIAPTGGVQKTGRAPKNAPTAPAVVPPGDSKIMVSNLPIDLTETLIKDFFAKAVGNVKKVLLAYGPNGRSRGEATVVFNKSTKAAEAFKQFNGVEVDKRPMRIELVGTTTAAAPAVKSLADRMSKPKNAAKVTPKAAAGPKKDAAKPAINGEAKAGRGKKKSGRAGRPKAKTADELDAEMADYFGTANGDTATNGTAQPAAAANGDAMDEVS